MSFVKLFEYKKGKLKKKMETTISNVQPEKNRLRLCEHPRLALVAFMVITVLTIALAGTVIFDWIRPSKSS